MISAPILCKYYSGGQINSAEYNVALTAANIDHDIQSIAKKILRAHKGTAKKAAEIRRKLEPALTYSVSRVVHSVGNICTCGGNMELSYDYTFLTCPICGEMRIAVDLRTKEDNSGTDTATKKGTHSPTKHYEHWAARIQGIETKSFDKDHLNRIKAVMIKNGITSRQLSCDTMREILKDKSVLLTTELNEHVTKLIKEFGGPQPYQLTPNENRQAKEMFSTIMFYYEKQHPGEGNRPYYPYFIYKIYEHMFKSQPRKLCILNFIHLQGEETVRKHDNDLLQICNEAGDELPLKYSALI
jgi:predicted RNA-binding Zn-ribbon protein involved in translation (DUF1610 family)